MHMSDVEYKLFRLYHFETRIKVFCTNFDKEAKNRISSFVGVRYVTFSLLYSDWVPVTKAWRFLSLRLGERPPIWSVAANILNKQSRTTDKGWSSSLGFGRGANNSSPEKLSCCETVNVLRGRPRRRREDNIKMHL